MKDGSESHKVSISVEGTKNVDMLAISDENTKRLGAKGEEERKLIKPLLSDAAIKCQHQQDKDTERHQAFVDDMTR